LNPLLGKSKFSPETNISTSKLLGRKTPKPYLLSSSSLEIFGKPKKKRFPSKFSVGPVVDGVAKSKL